METRDDEHGPDLGPPVKHFLPEAPDDRQFDAVADPVQTAQPLFHLVQVRRPRAAAAGAHFFRRPDQNEPFVGRLAVFNPSCRQALGGNDQIQLAPLQPFQQLRRRTKLDP